MRKTSIVTIVAALVLAVQSRPGFRGDATRSGGQLR